MKKPLQSRAPSASFTATLKLGGKTATGIVVPESAVSSISASRRVSVVATINGYTYRSTVAPMGGRFMLPVSAEHREGAGIAAGDSVRVKLALDTQPRTVAVPPLLAAALERDPEARRTFESLSYSNRNRHALAITTAKTDDTRDRRLSRILQALRADRAQP